MQDLAGRGYVRFSMDEIFLKISSFDERVRGVIWILGVGALDETLPPYLWMAGIV